MATREHCIYCFDSIISSFQDKTPRDPTFENLECPLFVTWKKNSVLRGCIGTFSSLPLQKGLYQYALTAAFKDERFPPILENEVPELSCSISILTEFEQILDYNDWEIGVHGLRLKYLDFKSTYLPQVAREQGWSRMETLKSLLKKAGYKGEVDQELLSNLELTKFQVYNC